MKKLLIAAWSLLFLLWICLLINHINNEHFISDYEDSIYEKNNFTMFGFFEPYICHYNQGNVAYQNGNYEAAIEEYEKALKSGISQKRDCLCRINIALSMVAPIDIDDINDQNIDETINQLKEAKQVLTENGCAHENDSDGHNEDAQQLKEDIDELIEQLEQQKQASDDNSQNTSNPYDSDSDSDTEDKKQQLEELHEQSQQERDEEIAENAYWEYLNQPFYYGPSW